MFVKVHTGWFDAEGELQDKRTVHIVKKQIVAIEEVSPTGCMIYTTSGTCFMCVEEKSDIFDQMVEDK